MTSGLRRRLVLAVVAAAVAVPVATASAEAAPEPAPTTTDARSHAAPVSARRWYRISATVVARHVLRDTETGLELRNQRSIWTVESNAAVVLFRQCAVSPGVRDGLFGRSLALVVGAPQESCAAIRRELRRDLRGASARSRRETLDIIRALREDLRFRARGTAQWTLHSHQWTLKGDRAQTASGEVVTCPPWGPFQVASISGVRSSGALVSTVSLLNKGVSVDPGARPRSFPTRFVRPEYQGCFDPSTGAQLRSGPASDLAAQVALRDMASGRRVGQIRSPLRPDVVTDPRVGLRFWRNFTLGSSQTKRAANGVTDEVATVKTTVRFRLCPRRGRDVRSC